MESRLDALILKQNQRITRLLCKACKQNNRNDCWHCFKCGHEAHTTRFVSKKEGNQ